MHRFDTTRLEELVLRKSKSLLVNFEFSSRRFLPDPISFLSKTLDKTLSCTTRRRRWREEQADMFIHLVAAREDEGTVAYRFVIPESFTAPFTLQYLTPEAGRAAAIAASLLRIHPAAASLESIEYEETRRLRSLRLPDLHTYFNQSIPGAAIPPNAESIITTLWTLGWTIYPMQEGGIDFLNGPACTFLVGRHYSLLPRPENPDSPESLFAASVHADFTGQSFTIRHFGSADFDEIHCQRETFCFIGPTGHYRCRYQDAQDFIRNRCSQYKPKKKILPTILN